jgi:hypothetical protein
MRGTGLPSGRIQRGTSARLILPILQCQVRHLTSARPRGAETLDPSDWRPRPLVPSSPRPRHQQTCTLSPKQKRKKAFGANSISGPAGGRKGGGV